MSDNRKILSAKRRHERNKFPSSAGSFINKREDNNFKKGVKRSAFSNDTPKKNIANDRMKRLRTSLNEEVRNSSSESSKVVASSSTTNPQINKSVKYLNYGRKRAQAAQSQCVSTKVFRKEIDSSRNNVQSSGYVFKEEFIHKSNHFTTVTENPFPVSNLSIPENSADANEDMEWSTVDNSEEIVSNTCTSPSSSLMTFNRNSCDTLTSDLFIVVDTNIFLSQMQLIRDIISMTITGSNKPIIFIPWIVIEELDFIKEDSSKKSLKFKARDAIKYIEKTLCEKHPRIRGQTLNEANEQNDVGKSQDNKIIATCIQVVEKHKHMILLTNDVNMRNKAHINNIPVCSHTDIMTKILLILNNEKAQIILEKMTTLCSIIIRKCAKNAYGDACTKMPICQSIPKSLEECMVIFTKYWFPVFQEILMKQFKKSVDDLSAFMARNKTIRDDSPELNELLRLCIRVCLFLKDVTDCKDTIESTISDLNNIKVS
jgi:rRNA-processing protein FCF1